MFWFIVAIVLALAGLACVALARFNKGENEYGKSFDYRVGTRIVGVIVIILAFLLFAVTGLKSVPTKNIGIPIAFGKITGQPFNAGIHETWEPWLHLADVSKRVQTTTFEVNRDGQGGLDVRIGGQQTAKLDITIQWQVQDSAADNLFLDYGANGDDIMADIRNAVVVRSLKSAANAVMGDYNPIQDVSLNSTAGNSQFTKFAGQIKAAMIHDIGGRIKVLSVLLPLAHYDDSTQARLNAIQQQYAETAIAKQQLATNKAQAAANDALRKSVGNDPNVLIANCEQIVKEAIKANYQGLPATFCSVGSNTTGVVVPARK